MQQIERPHGVTTFGSHLVRVTPDRAVVRVAINRTAAAPADAFRDAREATAAVRAFLRGEGLDDRDIRTSEITLQTQYRHANGGREFVGHHAHVQVGIVLADASRVEPLLVGVVERGADQVVSVSFTTTQLREHRATARTAAIAAARAKAVLYCEAAGCKLGKVLHIEDIDPTHVGRREYGHVVDTDAAQLGDADPGAYHPGSITVSGAVVMAFAIL